MWYLCIGKRPFVILCVCIYSLMLICVLTVWWMYSNNADYSILLCTVKCTFLVAYLSRNWKTTKNDRHYNFPQWLLENWRWQKSWASEVVTTFAVEFVKKMVFKIAVLLINIQKVLLKTVIPPGSRQDLLCLLQPKVTEFAVGIPNHCCD